MYYVSTKGGGGGPAKCLLLLTWGEGGVKTLAYVIIFCNFFRAAREMIINIQYYAFKNFCTNAQFLQCLMRI